MKHNFTYLNPATNKFETALYRKTCASQAVRSIFRRILRQTNNDNVNLNVVIKDLDTQKEYYYKCMAIKNEQVKKISNHKVITIKYDINIIKLNKKCFE